jgi:SAM-dependent methyltransferase
MTAQAVQECRSCSGPLPGPFLHLGSTPVANRLLPAQDSPEQVYPLATSRCPECSLVQLAWELPAGDIFDEDYPYFSSYSDYLIKHAAEHAANLIAELGLGPDSLVVEVGSNDGYLLQAFVEKGVPVLGIDPSPGPVAAARERGVRTEQAFFGTAVAADVVSRLGHADVVIANNVMAHVPDLNDVVRGFGTLVGDHGVLTVENPSVVEMIKHVEFDTIYHEHYCYFSCSSVRTLFARHGLTLFRAEDLPLHGGSLRWWGSRSRPVEASVTTHLADEEALGVTSDRFYADFAERVRTLQSELREMLGEFKADGKTIAAYGAAAKGTTLLTTTKIGNETIDFVVDRNEHKQNLFVPGARIPVLPVEELLARQPDYVLMLAWNVAEEILSQQDEYRRRGGQFIVPCPTPTIR